VGSHCTWITVLHYSSERWAKGPFLKSDYMLSAGHNLHHGTSPTESYCISAKVEREQDSVQHLHWVLNLPEYSILIQNTTVKSNMYFSTKRYHLEIPVKFDIDVTSPWHYCNHYIYVYLNGNPDTIITLILIQKNRFPIHWIEQCDTLKLHLHCSDSYIKILADHGHRSLNLKSMDTLNQCHF
jgi:hypothetical protein